MVGCPCCPGPVGRIRLLPVVMASPASQMQHVIEEYSTTAREEKSAYEQTCTQRIETMKGCMRLTTNNVLQDIEVVAGAKLCPELINADALARIA